VKEDPDRARELESMELGRLADLVRILRARCPWDRRQTHASLAPHLLEEAYETVDAIEDMDDAEPGVPSSSVAHLEEELGDVLFQVFFHAELAAEESRFTLADVARVVHDKLVSRHPHVFGDAAADTAEDVAARWEILKRSEKRRRGVVDAEPDAMPSLALASKLLKRADSLGAVLPDASEQQARVTEAAQALVGRPAGAGADRRRPVEAVGDALLALADLARRANVDPELALRARARRLREHLDEHLEEHHGEQLDD
jgi:tetrapyrrole methylase family protein / MazG family protein